MRRIQPAEQALVSFALSSRSQYICRTCRAHVLRQMHTTRALNAEEGFFQRMRQSFFGSRKTREAERERERKSEERAKQDAAQSVVRTKRDSKGNVYQVAAVVNTTTHPDYVPATNWNGLPRIGGEKWEKEQLDGGERYVGFTPSKRVKLNPIHWQKLLHHVAVEVLAMQKAGLDINTVCLSNRNDESWRISQIAKIYQDGETGKATVAFKSGKTEQKFISTMSKSRPDTEQSNAEASQTQIGGEAISQALRGIVNQSITPELLQDTGWMGVVIKDPLAKLAIAKRIAQLTGHRIPDPIRSNLSTLADLYKVFVAPEPPKKLAQTPELHMLQRVVPNVRVHAKRQTPIHKEKAIGRWKLIEEELVARDLPVTGSRWRDAKPRLGIDRR